MNAPSRTLSPLLLPLALALACGTPPVASALDQYTCPADGGPCVLQPADGVIQGSVIYQGARRGDAILLLFAADDLPPPDGTATASVEIARIPAATLFAGAAAGSIGPFSAPYLFTEVPPGSYQIRAFLDLGGDFDPFADFTQSPHAGAPTGGTVTFSAQGVASLADFTVASNQVSIEQVILGQEVPFDPPAFQLAPGSTTSYPQDIDRPQALVLETFNPNVPHATFADPEFTLQLDPDANGNPQEPNQDGILALYPQVTLLQTQALQADGSLLPVSGEAAAIVPCEVSPISTWPVFAANPQAVIGVNELTVLIEPLAVQLNAAGVATPLPTIPAGQYELVVAERTGQVWTLPNSLGSQAMDSGFYVASQATTIEFSAVVPPGGAISGIVQYPAGYTPHNLIIQAFKGGPQLAPPLSAQLPARVLSVPARFISLNGDHQYAFTLADLTPGSYVVEALDDGDDNFSDIDILETPTRGDLIGGIFDMDGNLATLTVGSTPLTGQTVALVGAPGQNGQGQGVALDPPAFVIDTSAGAPQISQDARTTVRIGVTAQPDIFPALDQQAATTLFTVALVRDSAGNPVDADGDGLPDIWPRAFLVEIDPADPEGLALLTPNIALPAAVDPTPFLPALLAGGPGAVLPATSLSIIVRPSAVSLANPAAPARLPVMPAGRYKLILMNETGQFWEVPNSSGSAALVPAAAALVNTASQSVAFSVVPPAQAVPAGEIDGTLTFTGNGAFYSAYIFAYSTSAPPPPLGAGKPISIDYHAYSEFTGSAGEKQVAYALRGLGAGDYYVTALIDARGDFAVDPFLFAAAPGPGSFIGGVIDSDTLQLMPVAITSAAPTASESAIVSGATPLPARPSFVLSQGDTPITSDITTLFPDALTPQRLTLTAQTELTSQVVALAPETGPAVFPVNYQGCNPANPSEGVDTDFDNLPDLYPRILVVRLADSDPSGLTVDPADILIPADIDPTPYLSSLGACDTSRGTLAESLSVILQPIAVQPQADGSLVQMPIPAGRYGVVLESETGQVWRIPNELQPFLLDPRSAATSAGALLKTQGVGIRVAAQVPAASGGGISGAVTLAHESDSSFGNLIIAAYAADDPPPPLGLGRPVAVQVIPSPVVEQALTLNSTANGATIPYLLANLPPSDASGYLVLAMYDPEDQFSPSLDYLSTPGYLAQLAFLAAPGPGPTALHVASSVVTAPADIALDGASASDTIPFPRPAFSISPSAPTVSSSAASSAAEITLNPDSPLGVPYAQPASPMFHPTPALNASGAPYRDTSSGACNQAGTLPWASTKVYAAPIDTGERYVAYMQVDSCQFCAALTGTADCSGPLLAAPQPMGALVAVATNVAIDPLTDAPAGVALPPGHYALTIVQADGQSWTVPNALSAADPSQASVLTVTP